MGFGEAVRTCFSKYATFTGRARRAEFWWFYLFMALVGIAFAFVTVIIAAVTVGFAESSEPSGGAIAALIITLGLCVAIGVVLYIPFLAVYARRLHDMGQTGHWLWLILAGLEIVPFVMALFDSERRTNAWGPDPKAAERGPSQPPYAQPPYGQQQGYVETGYGPNGVQPSAPLPVQPPAQPPAAPPADPDADPWAAPGGDGSRR